MKVAVVGAGIVGVSAAEWLRRDGHAVTLIDRNDPGDPAQTSFGNAGILAAASIVPVPVPGLVGKIPKMLLDPNSPLHLRWSYLPRLLPWLIPFLRRANTGDVRATAEALATLLGDTVEQHQALSAGTPAAALITLGRYTHLYSSREKYDGDAMGHALRREHGFRMEALDRAAIEEIDPAIGPYYQFAASYLDHGWIADPGAYVAALARHFVEAGGTLSQFEVADIRPTETGADVIGGGATTGYDRVVLAGGVWSRQLARRLGHKAAMESERGYHVVFEGPNRMPPHPLSLTDGKFIAVPMADGLRCAGQVEFGGLDAGPSDSPYKVVRHWVKKLYPDLTYAHESRWMGHRPSTVDSLPFIGPSPKAPAIHFAFGAQHVGLTSGPKTGRLIADMISGRTPNVDLAPFRVGRFD